MSSTFRVNVSYSSAYPDPVRCRKGEAVDLFQKESEWPGWVWCRNARGKEGWIPVSYLTVDSNRGVLNRDYEATELTVNDGETLELLQAESGWGLCRSKFGEIGWVPLKCLEPTNKH